MDSKRDVLTRELALIRASAIKDVKYELAIMLKKNSRMYSGKCKIGFSLDKGKIKDKLIVDFIGNIQKLTVNGKASKYHATSASIEIPIGELSSGKNSIEAEYKNDYDKTGDGFHHFKDSEDGEEYLYMHLEPYSGHRVWPCFDQPDIKANFKLTVDSPKDWQIISNTPEESIKNSADKKTIIFKETPKISTYLFHVSAGNYIEYKDSFKGKDRVIPLRILCRKSLTKHFEENIKEKMFEYTKQGLAFYSEFFDFHYPFEKYDQLFVPEFNMGAMENVGAVTFVERLVFRHKPTRTELSRLANVVLHEMVHMWFGNLVTMKWWDDLWLNESFADYLSYYGMFKATEFNDAWQDFYMRKAWAYLEDQMITTHPIAADSPDTDIAFSNFDGISYAKGASVLKQLMFYIGEDNFRNGLRHYFKEYQWGNTELGDFLHCMEKSSGRSLKSWTDAWLKGTGVNAARPELKSKDGKITELSLLQIKNNSQIKDHEAKVALLYEDNSLKECSVVKEIELSYKGEKTEIKNAKGLAKPSLVFLNYQDHDYSKTLLDKESLDYAIHNIKKIKDPLTRQMILGSIWQMTRDAEVNPREYLRIVEENALEEQNLNIIESHFSRAVRVLAHYLSEEEYWSYSEKMYHFALNGLKIADKKNKNAWFGLVAATSGGAKSVEELVAMLEGKEQIKDFEFNQDQRWAAVNILEARGHEKADQLLEKEEKRDPSDKGKKSAFEARVTRLKDKQRHWDMFVDAEKHSLDYLREGMAGFYRRRQKKHMEKYSPLFFSVIKKIFVNKDRQYSKVFFEILFPAVFANDETIKRIDTLLGEKDLPLLLEKDLLKEKDEMLRTISIIKKFGSKK